MLVYVPPQDLTPQSINDNQSFYGGGFFWAGGGAQITDSNGVTGFGASGLSTPYVGFQIVCGKQSCSGVEGGASITAKDLGLQVAETEIPVLSNASGLWNAIGWVRGSWPLHFAGDSPSGICSLTATLAGQPVAFRVFSQDDTTWHQCDATGGVSATVDTTKFADGPQPLVIGGKDAAGLATSPAFYTRTEHVDNVQPTVAISGPTDAPSTAGAQVLTVSGAAGPSGLSSISCSLDGAPAHAYVSSTVPIPVSGVGMHHLTCTAFNNARDSSGTLAASAPATWSLDIRQPSVSTLSFAHIADALRCHTSRERVSIPAHWVTARTHGHKIRVKLPAQSRLVKVQRCHPRIRIVRTHSHGRTHVRRVVLLPHVVQRSTKRVGFGARTTISGWLGTAQGVALGGRTIQLLGGADDGAPHFRVLATVTTAANGTWTATIPKGPSRVLRAVFAGSATFEPSTSTPARVNVRAAPRVRLSTHHTHWGHSIVISGRLKGGFIPRGGELVVLKIGWGGGSAEIGHLNTDSKGRFGTRYTFLRGNGTVRYRIWAETALESAYPYASARSNRVPITVSAS